MIKSKQQPYCRWCGKPLRRNARSVWIEKEDSALTEYGRRTTEFSRYIFTSTPPTNKDQCKPLTNLEVVSVSYSTPGKVRCFGEWDGESYQSRGLFCSTTCAQEMGQSAAKHHDLVGPGYRERMREIENSK